MKNKELWFRYLVCLAVLAVGFILCRYILFPMHGMIEWPGNLFAAGIVILTAAVMLKAKYVPYVTSAAYTLAFFLGVLFQSNGTDPGGGTTNNLWIIWTVAFGVMILLSVFVELLTKKRK